MVSFATIRKKNTKCFKQSLKYSSQLQNVSAVPFIRRNRAMTNNAVFKNGSTLPGNAVCAAVNFTRVENVK